MGFQKFGTGDVIGEDKPQPSREEQRQREMDEKLREDGFDTAAEQESEDK